MASGEAKGLLPVQGMLQGAAGSLPGLLAPSVSTGAPHFIQRGREEKLGGREGVSGIEQQCRAISLGS